MLHVLLHEDFTMKTKTGVGLGACLTRGLITFLFYLRETLWGKQNRLGKEICSPFKWLSRFVCYMTFSFPLTMLKCMMNFSRLISPFNTIEKCTKSKRQTQSSLKVLLVIFFRSDWISNDNWNEIAGKSFFFFFYSRKENKRNKKRRKFLLFPLYFLF